MAIDTVARAEATPDHPQPFAELGLKSDEYERIRSILGRRPTSAELAMYSVMWSEHCSYKSSKVHLRQFGAKAPASDVLMVGIGENAGVVDIGDGWAVTFKIESHNHPSYVEPYQGAATGVGGIVRDILCMGARPLAVMDSLRFGPADAPDTQRVLPGVVAGIGGYGNCLGLPNIGGEVAFDPTYVGNPLVNALCVGAMRHEDVHLASARGEGNLVVLFGARTGGDGIGGVSVLASETFSEGGSTKRPSVQVGDPFMEKLLIECTLEVLRAGLVEGIQDLGGAGISCATSELASNGDGGMWIDLERVPLRDLSLTPEEILMSESQERMCAIVAPSKIGRFLDICGRWEVEAAVIGEVVAGSRLKIGWNGELIVDVPPRSVAHEGPVYERPLARPGWLDSVRRDAPTPDRLPRPATGGDLRRTLLMLLASPGLADKSWITDQYDRYVQGNTVLAMPSDAGVIRVDRTSGRGVAISTDCNGRFAMLDPCAGAQLALAEAYRNVAVTGAEPLAVTDCLNFGSPEDPAVMWQFAEAVRGLAEGCQALGVPVTGGNVSFYNQTGGTAILPTPVVGVLGVFDDVSRRTPMSWGGPRVADGPPGGGLARGSVPGGSVPGGPAAGDPPVWAGSGPGSGPGGAAAVGADGSDRLRSDGLSLVLLGETRDEFGGSTWAAVEHGHLGGAPPAVDLDAERALARVLIDGSREGLFAAAHDVSDGGLAVAVAEMALRAWSGVSLTVPRSFDPFVFLFSESAGRAIVAVCDDDLPSLQDLCRLRPLPLVKIGRPLNKIGPVEDEIGRSSGSAAKRPILPEARPSATGSATEIGPESEEINSARWAESGGAGPQFVVLHESAELFAVPLADLHGARAQVFPALFSENRADPR